MSKKKKISKKKQIWCTLVHMWRPSIYSLYVSTGKSRIQSGADHIYHISLAGIEMAASLCNLLSPCAMPQFLVVRICFSYADPTTPVIQDPAVKLTNQNKPRDLGYQHHLHIALSPNSKVIGLSHQSRQFAWVVGIKPRFPAVELQCSNWAKTIH